jgi:hypothetical protein
MRMQKLRNKKKKKNMTAEEKLERFKRAERKKH